MENIKTLDIHAPQLASKRIKITQYDTNRKVQISSNLLPLMGFEKGIAVVETPLGDGIGYKVELAEGKPYRNVKKIYSREYKSRRNNPLETCFETSSKRILDCSIPKAATHVHVTLTYGCLIIKPLLSHVADRLNSVLKAINPFTVFAACTSGVDAHASRVTA
jgi:DNA (cytosine-5)-methyltransferase 1